MKRLCQISGLSGLYLYTKVKPKTMAPEGSGVNGKPVNCISFCLGRNDEFRKEYLSTGY